MVACLCFLICTCTCDIVCAHALLQRKMLLCMGKDL